MLNAAHRGQRDRKSVSVKAGGAGKDGSMEAAREVAEKEQQKRALDLHMGVSLKSLRVFPAKPDVESLWT